MLAPAAQLGMNLLGAAESGQAIEHGDQRLGLPGTPDPGPPGRRWPGRP
jgi:hypothetical protein